MVRIPETNANLNEVLVLFGVGSHIINDIIFFHEQVAHVPRHLVAIFRLEYSQEAVVVIETKIFPGNQKVTALYFVF